MVAQALEAQEVFVRRVISPTIRRSVFRAAVIVTAASVSACAFTARLRQEHRQASLHRQQVEEAADRTPDAKADSAALRKQLAHETQLRQLQRELIARGDADSLAASALFERALSDETNATALSLAARAVAGAPERVELVFLQLQLCESVPTCDARPVEMRLRQLDPQNGITWVYALQRAEAANSGAAWRAARDSLARSTRITLYWNRTISRLAGAASDKAGFDSAAATLEVVRIEGILLGALPPVSRACSPQGVQQPDVLDQCRRIATAFRNADRTLLEVYGTTLAVGLWSPDSPEGREITAERRGLSYRADLMTNYRTKFGSTQATNSLMANIAKYPTEQAAFRALIADLGLNPDPPASWSDQAPAR